MTSGGQTRVGVVADNPMRLLGLLAILEDSDGLSVRPTSLEEAIAADDLGAAILDSACVDNLLDVLARFRRERPAVKTIVLGYGLDPDWIQSIIAAGAKGYLPETSNEGEVRMAMSIVLDGSVWAPRKVMARLIEAGGVKFAPGETVERCSDQMTKRELQVLGLLKDGQTNRQIALTMGIESVTVKAHLGRMLRKAGVKNRVELTLKALAEGPPVEKPKKVAKRRAS
jgi:DNA-binding NarL/FixJ family response regulator